jgi:hypothetical protein
MLRHIYPQHFREHLLLFQTLFELLYFYTVARNGNAIIVIDRCYGDPWNIGDEFDALYTVPFPQPAWTPVRFMTIEFFPYRLSGVLNKQRYDGMPNQVRSHWILCVLQTTERCRIWVLSVHPATGSLPSPRKPHAML